MTFTPFGSTMQAPADATTSVTCGALRAWWLRLQANRRTDLTCPRCSKRLRYRMPLLGRVRALRCHWCSGTISIPLRQHCVFCAHGSLPCPRMQVERVRMRAINT